MPSPDEIADVVDSILESGRSPTRASVAAKLSIKDAELKVILASKPHLQVYMKTAQLAARRAAKQRYYDARDEAIANGRFVEYLEPKDLGRPAPNEPGRISPKRQGPHY